MKNLSKDMNLKNIKDNIALIKAHITFPVSVDTDRGAAVVCADTNHLVSISMLIPDYH